MTTVQSELLTSMRSVLQVIKDDSVLQSVVDACNRWQSSSAMQTLKDSLDTIKSTGCDFPAMIRLVHALQGDQDPGGRDLELQEKIGGVAKDVVAWLGAPLDCQDPTHWSGSLTDASTQDFAIVGKLLRTVAKLPLGREWVSLCDHLATAVRLFRGYQSATSSAAPAGGADADATANLVLPLSRAMACLQNALKANKKLDGSDTYKRHFGNFGTTVYDFFFPRVLHILEPGIRQVVLNKLTAAAARLSELQMIAGGGPNGTAWHSGWKDDTDIVLHGENALLNKAFPSQCDKHVTLTQESVAVVKAEIGSHQCLYPGTDWIPGEFKNVYKDAAAALRVASIAKAEFMILTAFKEGKEDDKAASKVVARIKRVSAQLGSDCSETWQKLIHPGLVAAMQKALDTDKVQETDKKKEDTKDGDEKADATEEEQIRRRTRKRRRMTARKIRRRRARRRNPTNRR